MGFRYIKRGIIPLLLMWLNLLTEKYGREIGGKYYFARHQYIDKTIQLLKIISGFKVVSIK